VENTFHVTLGDNRRLALPAKLCRSLGFSPGDELLLIQDGNRLSIASLSQQAEQMREELRGMLKPGKSLTAKLKELRESEA